MSCPDTFAGRSLGLVIAALATGCGASPPPAKDFPPAPAPPPEPPAVATAAPSEAPSTPGPVVIAGNLGVVDDLVAGDAFLYVVKKKSVVTRLPIGGGPPADIATFEGQAIVESIAPAAEGLYVLITAIGADATKQGYAGQGSLFLIPAKGGDAQSLAQGFQRPSGLIVDDTQLHWTAVKDAAKGAPVFLFSAPRKTGAPLTAVSLAEKAGKAGNATNSPRTKGTKPGKSAKAAAGASDVTAARLLGEYKGDAVVASATGEIFIRPFARGGVTAVSGTAGFAGAAPFAAIAGDRLALAGSAAHDGKATSVVGLASLAAPGQELVPLATLDGAATLGGVTFLGDDVVYTLAGTKEKHDKDGSIVRVSAADKKATVLATDQFQPTTVVVTPRGLVWLDKGATDTDEPDGTLVLLPK
jgi:hypothetical protein